MIVRTGSRTAFSHDVLTSAAEVGTRCAGWNKLVQEEYDGNPFLSLDWHLLWLRHFARRGTSVRYVVVRNGEEAVGYFPCVVRKVRFHRLPVRLLSYAGNVYTPVQGPVIRKSLVREVTDYFVRRVLPGMSWSVAQAAELPEEYPGTDELRAALVGAGYEAHCEPAEGNWVWDEPAVDSAGYFARLKYNIRSDIRRFSAKLAERGRLTFQLVSTDADEKHVADYRLVYSRSWKRTERHPAFHPDLIRLAARRGWLRLGLLYLDETPLAAQLWLFSQQRGYVVKVAYDEDYARFSPGTLLTWHLVQRLMDDEGMRFFDYLRGDDSYKKYWCNRRRQRTALVAFRGNAAGTLLYCLDRIALPRIRQNRVLNWMKRGLTSLVAGGKGAA